MDLLDGSDVEENVDLDLDQSEENALLYSDDEEIVNATEEYEEEHYLQADEAYGDVLELELNEQDGLEFDAELSEPSGHSTLAPVQVRASAISNISDPSSTTTFAPSRVEDQGHYEYQGSSRKIEGDDEDDDDNERNTRSRFQSERTTQQVSSSSSSMGNPIQTLGGGKVLSGDNRQQKQWNNNGRPQTGQRQFQRPPRFSSHPNRHGLLGEGPRPGMNPFLQPRRPQMQNTPVVQFQGNIFTDFNQPMRHGMPRMLHGMNKNPNLRQQSPFPRAPNVGNNSFQPMVNRPMRPPNNSHFPPTINNPPGPPQLRPRGPVGNNSIPVNPSQPRLRPQNWRPPRPQRQQQLQPRPQFQQPPVHHQPQHQSNQQHQHHPLQQQQRHHLPPQHHHPPPQQQHMHQQMNSLQNVIKSMHHGPQGFAEEVRQPPFFQQEMRHELHQGNVLNNFQPNGNAPAGPCIPQSPFNPSTVMDNHLRVQSSVAVEMQTNHRQQQHMQSAFLQHQNQQQPFPHPDNREVPQSAFWPAQPADFQNGWGAVPQNQHYVARTTAAPNHPTFLQPHLQVPQSHYTESQQYQQPAYEHPRPVPILIQAGQPQPHQEPLYEPRLYDSRRQSDQPSLDRRDRELESDRNLKSHHTSCRHYERIPPKRRYENDTRYHDGSPEKRLAERLGPPTKRMTPERDEKAEQLHKIREETKKTIGLDDDYEKKLEEQKRLRAEILIKKAAARKKGNSGGDAERDEKVSNLSQTSKDLNPKTSRPSIYLNPEAFKGDITVFNSDLRKINTTSKDGMKGLIQSTVQANSTKVRTVLRIVKDKHGNVLSRSKVLIRPKQQGGQTSANTS